MDHRRTPLDDPSRTLRTPSGIIFHNEVGDTILLGGDKTGNDRWYEEHVTVADALYEEYLRELEREGLI